ncbi:hypothetical protein NFI96_020379, partial [Prochilodus magdalenae]
MGKTKEHTIQRYWDFNWDRVLWSDETKIELFGNKCSKWIWLKYAEKHLMPTVKYGGGSVMLWACFSSKGPGNLVRVHGIMNALKYQDILKQNLVTSARKLKIVTGSFSKIMTLNIWPNLHRNGSPHTESSSSHGHLSPQTSTPLKTCG